MGDEVERRKRMIDFEDRLVAVEEELKGVKSELMSNSAATTRVEKNTADLVAIFKTAKGVTRTSVKFGLWLATTLKWIGGLALAIGTIWAVVSAILNGKPPSLH